MVPPIPMSVLPPLTSLVVASVVVVPRVVVSSVGVIVSGIVLSVVVPSSSRSAVFAIKTSAAVLLGVVTSSVVL